MCGIAGKISFTDSSCVSESLLKRMNSILVHRGPDDEGIYVALPRKRDDAIVGLAHRRLSIIDLSPTGHQPMCNEDHSIWIILNGEIYNFIELRDLLKKKGHIFRSRTDTEVIIHLYEDMGIECLHLLRGAFALALWDEKKQSLFLARDRIGKRPLYYHIKNGTLTFASEMKAILQDPQVLVEINQNSIVDYLTYGYIPTPQTIFANIYKLPPAHFMEFKKDGYKIQRYWSLDFSKKLYLKEAEYIERLMDVLGEATRIRLISDVPLGVFLSGGMDSSTVVYLMSKINPGSVKTFSIGFDESPYSELKYARIVANQFGTEHHEYIVRPEAIKLLPRLVWHYNEPYADSSALPSYYVAKMTRQKVKVALNGDGGDENFGGYERFMAARYAEFYRNIPSLIRDKILHPLIARLPSSKQFNDSRGKLKRFISVASKPYKERHYNWVSIFRDEEKNILFTDEYKKAFWRNSIDYLYSKFDNIYACDIAEHVMAVDIHTNLLDDLLVKMDIATMANSLESRSPFLDHKVLEFCAQMPGNLKIRRLTLKYILKKALRKILPEPILTRGKMGFGVPIDDWFRSELKEFTKELLLSNKSLNRGYFNKNSIKKILDEHFEYKANNGSKIWSLLNLELWHRIFIDKDRIYELR